MSRFGYELVTRTPAHVGLIVRSLTNGLGGVAAGTSGRCTRSGS
jgi:hypothetical protein